MRREYKTIVSPLFCHRKTWLPISPNASKANGPKIYSSAAFQSALLSFGVGCPKGESYIIASSTESATKILLGQFVLRVVEHLLGIALFDDLTQIHEDDVVGYAQGLAQRVGNHHDRVLLL